MSEQVHFAALSTVANALDISLPKSWCGLDAVWPMVDRIRMDGAVVVVKVDGQRNGVNDNGQYSVIISGGGLFGDYVTSEHQTLEESLAESIVKYARKAWAVDVKIGKRGRTSSCAPSVASGN